MSVQLLPLLIRLLIITISFYRERTWNDITKAVIKYEN